MRHLSEFIREQHGGDMIIDGYHGDDSICNSEFDDFKQHCEDEVIDEDTIFIGSEVETGRANPFTQNMLNTMAEKSKDFQCERDSSIPACHGCEIISAPLTLKYWKEKSGYRELFEYLKSIDVSSYSITNHNTGSGCGCHFHLSRVKGWKRAVTYMAMFIDQNRFVIEAICGRPFTNYATNNIGNMAPFDKTVPDLVENYIISHIQHSYIINLEHSNTIEFRLCQGTLNYDTYMARLEFVYYLYKSCLDIVNGKARLDRLTINQVCQHGEFLPKYLKKLGISCSAKLDNKTREYRKMVEDFIITKRELTRHLQSLRSLIENSVEFENRMNAYRTIESNCALLSFGENTISTITSALRDIKSQNRNTLSRALDNYSSQHPTTALAKQYLLCKKYIEELEIPDYNIKEEEF